MQLDAIAGAPQRVSWGVFSLQRGDALYVRWNGAGGVGDPFRRRTEAVLADVQEGIVSVAAARSVYGVAIDGGGHIDVAATQALRGTRAAPQGNEAASARPLLIPGLCGRCGYREGGKDPSQLTFTVKERLMSELGSAYSTGVDTLLRELLCPSCGTQVDAYVALRGDTLLHDRLEEGA